MTDETRLSGRLIAIEGINGAGKSTHCKLALDALAAAGVRAGTFKSPAPRTATGQLIERALFGSVELPPDSLLALFTSNRLEIRSDIELALGGGLTVICDRYSESEYAYGTALGLPLDWLKHLESRMPTADLVVLLDLPGEPAYERARRGAVADRFEHNAEFLEVLRQRYLQLARNPPRPRQPWAVLDATLPIPAVSSLVLRAIQEHSERTSMEPRVPPM